MNMKKHGHPRMFIDSLRLYLRGGRGGPGYPKYGGIGGKGGDIYVAGKEDHTLQKTKKLKPDKRWQAENGKPSSNFRLFGDSGKDVVIPVPLGTSIETEVGQNLGEILKPEDQILVARGGAGGHPDSQFAGKPGEVHHIKLLLKLIADIGLVGFPNAGKSTLLRSLSHAKPKVASYPFTTLHPTVGIMLFDDQRKISVADLPGLIEGAWCNTGMGHKFLRHVERTKLLLFVVDVDGFRLGPEFPHRSATETIILLNKELELYQPELVEKPSILLINKMDKRNSHHQLKTIKKDVENLKESSMKMPKEFRPERFMNFGEILNCSAKYDVDSILNVKDRLRKLIDLYQIDEEDYDLNDVHNRIKGEMYEANLKLL